MMNRIYRWASLSVLTVAIVATQCAAEFSDYRALWVTRWDYWYTNPSTVHAIVDNAASMGITDLMFQVRGRADAFYESAVEPRAEGLSNNWDPLQTAIDRAASHGMNLHAWINTMPLWYGETPPQAGTQPPHPFYHSPSYRVHDLNGSPQPLNSTYVVANPILPEWHNHVADVVTDIVNNYEVDGVHLDYTRWLGPTGWSDLPHDTASHQMFTDATGLPATAANVEPYRNFIRSRITDFVANIRSAADAADPNLELSAAVWRDPDVGRSQVLQDYRTWMQQDLVDTVIPMIYLSPSNNHLFQPNLSNVLAINTNARVAPGLGVYLHNDPQFTVSQLQTLYDNGADGATLFAYSSFFQSGNLGVERFAAVTDYLDTVGRDLVPLTDFEIGEGFFESSPTASGSNQGIQTATADRVTGESLNSAAAQRLVVDGSETGWFLRHLSGKEFRGEVAGPSGNLAFSADGYVGVWLKTENAGLEVSLAVDDPTTADRGLRKSIIPDGEWHVYEWNLDDDDQWEAWVGGNGIIDGDQITLDSLQFWGAGDVTIYIDDLTHSPQGSIHDLLFPGDFDRDTKYTTADVDELVANIAAGSAPLAYDLDGNGQVNRDDLQAWLAIAGAANLGEGRSYLMADANLDGVVDGIDFIAWNDHKFSNTAAWSAGDFNADGSVDGNDFITWNILKFLAADAVAVPEPTVGWGALLLVGFWGRRNFVRASPDMGA